MIDKFTQRTILDNIWSDIENATKSGNAFSTMCLSTITVDNRPKSRTIMLRRADYNEATITFSTDIRSGKIKEITCNPYVSLVGYDRTTTTQIRIEGKAEIDKNESDRQKIWNNNNHSLRRLFTSLQKPGSEIDDPNEMDYGINEGALIETPPNNFAIISIRVEMIEWLDLDKTPHQRLKFRQLISGWEANWLAG